MEEKNCCDKGEDCCGHGCCDNYELKIGSLAPSFEAEVYHEDKTKRVKLSDYQGKWVILFFYPADFTFVCPTELGDLASRYEEIKKLNTEILSVSTDTIFVHKAWHDESETIKKVNFPMLADPTHEISYKYNVLIEEEGLALRGTFIIDPKGILKTMEVHDNGIGRSSDELIRKLQAAQFVAKYGDQVCPANWQPGQDTLKPGLDLVGKI
ncbi:MAG: redoxin domain-containing protein [Patescibacteria group bacterium]|jgi:peroxiredoxin (alkyl hydroperoxide reductase subunit C)